MAAPPETVYEFVRSLEGMLIPPKKMDPEDRTCSICKEKYVDASSKMPIKLTCGHVFGFVCILQWLSLYHNQGGRNACPVCCTPLFKTLCTHKIDIFELYAFLVEERSKK